VLLRRGYLPLRVDIPREEDNPDVGLRARPMPIGTTNMVFEGEAVRDNWSSSEYYGFRASCTAFERAFMRDIAVINVSRILGNYANKLSIFRF
jgi:hypothetical protein